MSKRLRTRALRFQTRGDARSRELTRHNARLLRLSKSRRMHLLAVPDSPRPGNRQIPRPAHALASERHRSTIPRMRRASARCCNAPAGTCLNLLAQSKSALQEWAEDVERRAAKQSRTSPADVPAVGPHAHFTVATVAGDSLLNAHCAYAPAGGTAAWLSRSACPYEWHGRWPPLPCGACDSPRRCDAMHPVSASLLA